MKHKILAFSFLVFTALNVWGQNPFQSIGKPGKMLTLSKGQFDEIVNNDSLQRIGSVIVNIRTKQIVQFIQYDTVYSEATLEPTVISRHWSIDPKAHEMPNWSPYSSVKCNPILYIDPDGAFPYTFHIRAFAPTGSFSGTGFHDDGRGFSSSTDVTSRIKQQFTVDPTAKTFSGGRPTSDPTFWNGFNQGTATDQGGASASFGSNSLGSATAAIGAEFSGSNPSPAFMGMAPAISVSSAIAITENVKNGTLTVSIDLSSKQFPATEGLIQDSKGNTIFLAGAAALGNVGGLMDNKQKQVASMDLVIGIDSKGVFQNVSYNGTTYSVDEFNKLGTSLPAHDKVTTPEEE